MERISKYKDREVLSSDGNLVGWVMGFTFASVGNWNVTSVTMKVEKDTTEVMGKKKPFMGALMVDVGVETIASVSDNILLNRVERELRPYVKDYVETKNIANVIDKEIVDKDGKDIGTIEDVMVDVKRWMLPSVLVKLDKDTLEMLRMEKAPDIERRVTIPMSNVKSIGDKVMLNIDKERLGELVQKAPVKTM